MNQTLPQRLYLICYTVDKGKFEVADLRGRGQLLRAGALTELSLDGLLTVEKGKVARRAAKPPSDSFLAEVWRDTPTEKPKNWIQFVHNKAYAAEEPVRDQLATAGGITLPSKRNLSPITSHQVTVNDPQQILALQETARNAVLAGLDPAAIPADELTLAVLPAECEVTSVFTRDELREHKHTLKALTERFDELVPGLRKALRDSFLSSRAVGGGWGI
ncbi:GOLPH3/VPS74 family protein [Streptomyces pinistramenti]|uniref:GOLPH3/VPS74 family protein n=1 Tax=Streptomyces pinistramenti TaxID=2884812 RepID=UPI001D068993|nr:GPP34 family phosphoprotein [Streptomyces pinistramenti]MCB5907720.1 GPP34 family phosphoprotein [Streptomyces pinistramenti]